MLIASHLAHCYANSCCSWAMWDLFAKSVHNFSIIGNRNPLLPNYSNWDGEKSHKNKLSVAHGTLNVYSKRAQKCHKLQHPIPAKRPLGSVGFGILCDSYYCNVIFASIVGQKWTIRHDHRWNSVVRILTRKAYRIITPANETQESLITLIWMDKQCDAGSLWSQ